MTLASVTWLVADAAAAICPAASGLASLGELATHRVPVVCPSAVPTSKGRAESQSRDAAVRPCYRVDWDTVVGGLAGAGVPADEVDVPRQMPARRAATTRAARPRDSHARACMRSLILWFAVHLAR